MKLKLSTAATAAAAAGAIGLGALTVPAMAGAAPSLPPVSPEDLVASVMRADPPAFGGTVEVDHALGLPSLPGMAGPDGSSPLTQPVTTFRAWSDGHDRGRLALPSRNGEQVFVADGSTLWHYDSAKRTATALKHEPRQARAHHQMTDPAQAAQAVVGAVRKTSTVTVDGTGTVADRPVYELVLSPAPTERTLLREVRVAVDSATRMPLQLSVLANGSPDPALQVGFTDLSVGPQDPGLFTFTPPPGVRLEKPKADRTQKEHGWQGRHPAAPFGGNLRTVGDGWDTVVVGSVPPAVRNDQQGRPGRPGPRQQDGRQQDGRGGDPAALLEQVGTPVSGPWGKGWVIRTAVGTVLVASDGRFAAGAVPPQVLTETLSR